jgi:hypothetical protein
VGERAGAAEGGEELCVGGAAAGEEGGGGGGWARWLRGRGLGVGGGSVSGWEVGLVEVVAGKRE